MPRKLSRIETIENLLETLREAQQTHSSSTGSEDGDLLLRYNPLYNAGTYRELERCLLAMVRNQNTFRGSRIASLRFHVTGFYCAPTKIHRRLIKRSVGQSTETIEIQEVVRLTSKQVKPNLARAGVEYISSIFAGEPFLPDEIWKVVAA